MGIIYWIDFNATTRDANVALVSRVHEVDESLVKLAASYGCGCFLSILVMATWNVTRSLLARLCQVCSFWHVSVTNVAEDLETGV